MRNSCDCVQKRQTRKIGPTRRSVSGVYAFRGAIGIQFESTLERDFLIRKEFALCVIDVISQPVQIPFIGNNGQEYVYTPDFLVFYRSGKPSCFEYPKPLLVEVKPGVEWKKHWREWLPKWKAAYRYANEHGWEFHIHDESRIRDQTLTNIRFLDRYKRMQFPAEESRLIIENIQQMGSAPFHCILACHFMEIYKTAGIANVWYLLATRQLDCDMTLPLNDFTELWVSSDE